MRTYQEIENIVRQQKHKGREGVPSCSMLDRLLNCPGSWEAQKGFKNESSDAAFQGSVEHYIAEVDDCPDDAPDEVKDRYHIAKNRLEWIMNDTGYTIYAKELYHDAGFLTGTADVILVKNNSCDDFIVLDYKFGRTEVGVKTFQGAGNAALLFNRDKHVKRVRFGIIQPYVADQGLVEYNREWVEENIENPIKHIVANGGPFNITNKGCGFCPAMGTSKCDATKNLWSTYGNCA